MKNIINTILVVISLFIYSCNSIKEVHISKTVVFDGILYEIESDIPFSGIVYNTYSSGKREYGGKYKKGKPNGLLQYWYKSGQIMREGNLKNGSPIGRWNYFKEDGTIQSQVDY